MIFLFNSHNISYANDLHKNDKSFWKKRLFENTLSTKRNNPKSQYYFDSLREFKKKNFLKSKDLINKAIRSDNLNYDYLVLQAQAFKNLGLNSKAINQYKNISKIFPEKNVIFFEIGNTYLSSNNRKQAEEYFKKYLKACNFNCNKRELVKSFIK